MPVRRYRKDPRTVAERRADDSVRRLFERGELLEVDAGVEREAVDHVQGRYQTRRETVASLGKERGFLRRAHGLTQDQVALALGTLSGSRPTKRCARRASRVRSGLEGERQRCWPPTGISNCVSSRDETSRSSARSRHTGPVRNVARTHSHPAPSPALRAARALPCPGRDRACS